jgi:hypothetical protein
MLGANVAVATRGMDSIHRDLLLVDERLFIALAAL